MTCLQNQTFHDFPEVNQSSSKNRTLQGWIYWLYALYFPCAEFVAFLLQIALLATIFKSVKLKKPRFYLIISLAIGDLLWIAAITPIAVTNVHIQEWILPEFMCKAQGYLLYMLALQTKLTLTLVTYDRHQAICKAVTYRHFVTSNKYLCLAAFGWIYPAILASPPLFGWNSYQYNMEYFLCHITWDDQGMHSYYIYLFIGAGLVFPCNIAILVFYIKIVITAHRTHRNMSDQVTTLQSKFFKRELKVAKGVALVIGLYFLTSLPLTVIKYVAIFVGESDTLLSVAQVSHLMFIIPHLINPLIYGWMNREFKDEFLRVWHLRRPCTAHPSSFRERSGTSSFSEYRSGHSIISRQCSAAQN